MSTNRTTHSSFRTDALRADLKARSVRGAVHVALGRAGRFVVELGATMVLARLLAPTDFGLVAIALALAGFAHILRDSGLSLAAIQKPDLNHEQASNLFWASLLLSLAVALVTAAVAPLMAWAYGEPRLTGIVIAIAVSIFLGGIGLQHDALLRRELRLSRVNLASGIAELGGVVTALMLALGGAGYWALVGRTVMSAAVNSALLMRLCSWRPGRPARGTGIRESIRFGGAMTAAQVLGYVTRKIDDLLIGWAWGPAATGHYSRAYQLLLMPAYQLQGPIGSVVIPALSAIQKEPERFRRFYRRGLEMLAFFGYPLVVLLFVAADETVLTLLGDQWRETITIFRFLGPATVVEITTVAARWIFVPFGRGDRALKWTLISSPVYIAAIAAGLPWGGVGVALGVSISRVALQIPSLAYCYRDTPVKLSDLYAAVWRPALAAALSGILTALAEWSIGSVEVAPAVRLFVMTGVFGALYLLTFVLMPGGRQFFAETLVTLTLMRSERTRKLGA